MGAAELTIAALLAICTTFNSGLDALAQKDYDRAIVQLTEVIDGSDLARRYRLPARLARAEAYMAQGKPELARRDYAAINMLEYYLPENGMPHSESRSWQELAAPGFLEAGGDFRLMEGNSPNAARHVIAAMLERDEAILKLMLTEECAAETLPRLGDADMAYRLRCVSTSGSGSSSPGHWSISGNGASIRFQTVFLEDRYSVKTYELTLNSSNPRQRRLLVNLETFVAACHAWRDLADANNAAPTAAQLAAKIGKPACMAWITVDGGKSETIVLLANDDPDLTPETRVVLLAPDRPDGWLIIGFADGHSEIVEDADKHPAWLAYQEQLKTQTDVSVADFDAVVAILRTGGARERRDARRQIEAMGASALPHLERYKDDDDPEVRSTARDLIAVIPPPAAIADGQAANDPRNNGEQPNLFPALRQRSEPPTYDFPVIQAKRQKLITDYSVVSHTLQEGLEHAVAKRQDAALKSLYGTAYDGRWYNNLSDWAYVAIAEIESARGHQDAVLAAIMPLIRRSRSDQIINAAFTKRFMALNGTDRMRLNERNVALAFHQALHGRKMDDALSYWHSDMRNLAVGLIPTLEIPERFVAAYQTTDAFGAFVHFRIKDNDWNMIYLADIAGSWQIVGHDRISAENVSVHVPGFTRDCLYLMEIGRSFRHAVASGADSATLPFAALDPAEANNYVRFWQSPVNPALLYFPGADPTQKDALHRVVAAAAKPHDGRRLILSAQGSIRSIDEDEFQATLQDLPEPIEIPAAPEPVQE